MERIVILLNTNATWRGRLLASYNAAGASKRGNYCAASILYTMTRADQSRRGSGCQRVSSVARTTYILTMSLFCYFPQQQVNTVMLHAWRPYSLANNRTASWVHCYVQEAHLHSMPVHKESEQSCQLLSLPSCGVLLEQIQGHHI